MAACTSLPSSFATKGMLQGFHEEEILYFGTNQYRLAMKASWKAAELAMLGLAEEANSIVSLVGALDAANTRANSQLDLRLEFFWAESDTPRPAFVANPFESAASGSDLGDRLNQLDLGDRLNQLGEKALLGSTRFWRRRQGPWSFTEECFHEISNFVEDVVQKVPARFANATEGYQARELSEAYHALLSIAVHFGWEEKTAELMAKIASRIHADTQRQSLGVVRGIWRPYLLSGWLRDFLGVDVQALRTYAAFIRQTIERRLQNGPLALLPHIQTVYKDWTIRQIVEEIDQNTIAEIRRQAEDGMEFYDSLDTVTREPRTPEQIRDAELRIGHALPADMKEFYGVTDGFEQVRADAHPPYLTVGLRPLAEVSHEDWNSQPGEYPIELVRDLNNVPWPPILGGGIGFYENDGHGTLYTWIIGADAIASAKEALWSFHGTASEEMKQEIERKITRQFGSREVLDEMKQCCVYEQEFAGNGTVYPTFRTYLEHIAFGTRSPMERSPLKTEYVCGDYRTW